MEILDGGPGCLAVVIDIHHPASGGFYIPGFGVVSGIFDQRAGRIGEIHCTQVKDIVCVKFESGELQVRILEGAARQYVGFNFCRYGLRSVDAGNQGDKRYIWRQRKKLG